MCEKNMHLERRPSWLVAIPNIRCHLRRRALDLPDGRNDWTSIYEVHVTDKNAKSRLESKSGARSRLIHHTLSGNPQMVTIDNLWDEPVESEPAPHLAVNPVTSSEDPLFLQSDSDNEGRTGGAASRQSKAPDDIGALFDVDNDEENGQLSNVTYEQLRKDALSGGKLPDDAPSGGENQGAHEDPPEEGSILKSKSNKKDEDASTKRTIPKLNEELLLSEKGIPALIKDARQWKPKGKGHEASSFR
jgi:hypothetical protein